VFYRVGTAKEVFQELLLSTFRVCTTPCKHTTRSFHSTHDVEGEKL
jgi:hypothetical protein